MSDGDGRRVSHNEMAAARKQTRTSDTFVKKRYACSIHCTAFIQRDHGDHTSTHCMHGISDVRNASSLILKICTLIICERCHKMGVEDNAWASECKTVERLLPFAKARKSSCTSSQLFNCTYLSSRQLTPRLINRP